MVRLRSSANEGFISSCFYGIDKKRLRLTTDESSMMTGPSSSQNSIANTVPGDNASEKHIKAKSSSVGTGHVAFVKDGVIKTSPSNGNAHMEMMFDDIEGEIMEMKAQQKHVKTAIVLKNSNLLDQVYDDEDKDWEFLGFIDSRPQSRAQETINTAKGKRIQSEKIENTLTHLKEPSHCSVIVLSQSSSAKFEDMGQDWDFSGFVPPSDTIEDTQSESGKESDDALNDTDEDNMNSMEGVEMNDDHNESLDSPNPISRYEQIRMANIQERTEYLLEMGLLIKSSDEKPKPRKKTPRSIYKATVLPVRRSTRLSQSMVDNSSLVALDGSGSMSKKENAKEKNIKMPNSYGVINGVAIGATWPSRLDCCHAGIHRPTVAGIHSGPKGAYSVVLSGGYDDDIDNGDTFIYSGSGGRDLKGTVGKPKNLRVAPQSMDQNRNKSNKSLIYSCKKGRVVRVVRGFKLKSPYAPVEGYRYDGLYIIQKYWLSKGNSGFKTYKFLFKRCDNQDLPPWQSS